MILVTLAGSSFSWAFSSRRKAPVSFSIRTAEVQERFRPASAAGAAPAWGTAAESMSTDSNNDRDFFIKDSS